MVRSVLKRLLAIFALSAASAALAQGYPSRPIALVVPFSAGGPTDTIGRILAERMQRTLGQPIAVENIVGAGGTIAIQKVLKGPADGYTVILGHIGTHVLAPAVQGLNVDYVHDFDPVALVATNPEVIVSRLDVPAKTLQELLAWVKANPGKVSFASGGAGTPGHVMAANFGSIVAPLNILHYKGAAPAMLDVIGGHVDISFDQAATGLTHVRSGKVRAYAVTSKTRIPSAPDIPTVDEAGLPGFYMSVWHGIWVPRGTPQDVVMKLNAAVREALADPGVRKRLADLGQDVPEADQLAPEALRAQQRADTEKWTGVIKSANIRAN